MSTAADNAARQVSEPASCRGDVDKSPTPSLEQTQKPPTRRVSRGFCVCSRGELAGNSERYSQLRLRNWKYSTRQTTAMPAITAGYPQVQLSSGMKWKFIP